MLNPENVLEGGGHFKVPDRFFRLSWHVVQYTHRLFTAKRDGTPNKYFNVGFTVS